MKYAADTTVDVARTRAELERLARFVVDAGIEPQVDSVRPLAQAREGFEKMVRGQVSGKVVFTL